MTTPAAENPATASYYVGDAFYQDLVDAFGHLEADLPELADRDLRDRVALLLGREARLLEQERYDAWLDLFVAECAYWVPATRPPGDPRREITVAFHDRRQLEDRIFRIRTGYAWSQSPASRTVRQVTNIAVFALPADGMQDGGRLLARSTFQIAEFRDGDLRRLDGHAGHLLVDGADGLRIQAKQVNLIDCDQSLRNPSIMF